MRKKQILKNVRVTQGFGMLEHFLASLRVRKANQLVRRFPQQNTVLDIGCGSYPLFLMNTTFRERYGLDRNIENVDFVDEKKTAAVILKNYNLADEQTLPFEDDKFDAITMLAVLEHLTSDRAAPLVKEIHRILKPGGFYVLTTPLPWADGLLKVMAKMKLISSEEFKDHVEIYTQDKARALLHAAGFPDENISHGYFEFFMNLWVTAKKP